MSMSRDEVNRTIHEARGLRWHEWEREQHNQYLYCLKCPEARLVTDPSHPDYTSKEGFWDAWNWAKEEDWWDEFKVKHTDPHSLYRAKFFVRNFIAEDYISPLTFAPALAAFLKEREK